MEVQEPRESNPIQSLYRPMSILERLSSSRSNAGVENGNYQEQERNLRHQSKSKMVQRQLRFGHDRSDIWR